MHFLQSCWCLHPNPTFLLGHHPWVSHHCGGSPSYPSPSSGSTSSTPPAAVMCRVLPPPRAAAWVTPVGSVGELGTGRVPCGGCTSWVAFAPLPLHVGALPFPWDDVRAVLLRQIPLQRAGRWAGGGSTELGVGGTQRGHPQGSTAPCRLLCCMLPAGRGWHRVLISFLFVSSLFSCSQIKGSSCLVQAAGQQGSWRFPLASRHERDAQTG